MLHPRLAEQVLDVVEKGVVAAVDDLAYARVDDQLRAREAGGNGYVDRCALYGVAVQGGLADRVLLGMDAQALLQVAAALRGLGGQPPAKQLTTPCGIPLWPVESMWRLRTITAATWRREQFEREATTPAMFMKYSSQQGRGSTTRLAIGQILYHKSAASG